MQCRRCQHENPSGVKFCGACGARLELVCPSCQTANPSTNSFCHDCGQPLDIPASMSPTSAPARMPSEAERRQLTVMFCDLVDSTQLSSRLDPEVLREVVRAYQHVCGDEIARFAGHVAQYLGDGLLVYFGYPAAHEDDAQRAVRAALGILAALETLNSRLHREKGVKLAVRVGIHTGLVVVGEIGGASRHETLALGETPNIAARLQAIAEPDTVAISGATYRLVREAFSCLDLGNHAVKGLTIGVHAYRVQSERPAASPLETTASGSLTPLVGREQEVGLLLSRWEQVKDGRGQVALLSGEPGIGKSRLVRVLQDHIAGEPHTRWECRCSAYHHDSALYPVVDLFERALQLGRDDLPDQKLAKIDSTLARYGLAQTEAGALWAALLSVPLPDNHRPLNFTPQRQKQKTFEAILGLLLALATEQPLVFIIEDLHWADPSTRELLDLILEQVPTTSILMLLTFRPEFRPPWGHRAHLTQLPLGRFTRRQTEVMVERVTGGKKLPVEVVHQVVAKTDGVPLFVEELTKMLLESGLIREHEDRYELSGALPPLAIPSTLQDSLMARLDRLATVKDVAQLGAALGRTFPYELLAAVASTDDATLHDALARLVRAELLFQRGVPPNATYIFKHALIQDIAYQSMLMSRRQQLHQRIAHVLVDRFPETAELQPELIAHHCTEGSLLEQATSYWQRAGERAFERAASAEAVAHFTRGLETLKSLPDSPERRGREFDLQTALGVTLMATKGYADPETEHAYLRALELARQAGNPTQLFAAVWGLFWFSMLRAEVQRSREVGEELVSMAERAGDPSLLAIAHNALGQNLYYLGALPEVRPHLERCIAICDSGQYRAQASREQVDHGLVSRAHLALALWCLGYPDQGLEQSRQALRMAETTLAHPLARLYALGFSTVIHLRRQEGQIAHDHAEAMVALSREQGFTFWLAMATFRLGAALAQRGRVEEGIAKMREGLDAWRATGAELERPYQLAVLAEAYGRLGQPATGLSVLAEALEAIKKSGEGVWEAELHRLRGELLLAEAHENEHQAETCFRQAIDVASRQQARSLELRATVSLGRLLQRKGKREDARRVLAEIYDWFTEGLDTADLRDASALLDELSQA